MSSFDVVIVGVGNATLTAALAARELVGGLFYENYPGGSGLMAGAVYGKIAGENAAGHAIGNSSI